LRKGGGTGTTGLTWLLTDHLGSQHVSVSPVAPALTQMQGSASTAPCKVQLNQPSGFDIQLSAMTKT
jgi:hypothetical protein